MCNLDNPESGTHQRAKKVLSDSPGLVDFAIGLVNSVFNFPDRQVMFYEEFELQKNKKFLGLVEMTSGLVNASFSLPKWQAVKIIFFAPCPPRHCHTTNQWILTYLLYTFCRGEGDVGSRKTFCKLKT